MPTPEPTSIHRIGDAGRGFGTRVMAVTSGKGGVGKTTTAVNLGICLRRRGRRVLLLDADLGLANIDVMLNLRPTHNLAHVLAGDCELREAIVTGPGGIDLVPGASGIAHMADLGAPERAGLVHAFSDLAEDYDVLLVDTPAGIGASVIDFCAASQEVLVVVRDEPASLADAYAVIKVLNQQTGRRQFRVLVNQARSARAGRALFDRLVEVAEGYLSVRLELTGIVPDDSALEAAVRRRRAVALASPDSISVTEFKKVAERADNWPVPRHASGGIEFFFEHLVRPVVEEARA